jgi:sugar O-acyltransferase (sialic acid O-acetyltransferase NeuD family)
MGGAKQKLVIIGDGETAELAYDIFVSHSNYEVVAFSAERNFRRNQTLFGLPVVPLEEIEKSYIPAEYKAFVAVSYTQLNMVRLKLYNIIKEKGYSLCSCISPKAFIGNDTKLGENCFILENVTIQRGAKIGNNVTLWSGSLVGHRSVIGDNCFVASHVAISGFCDIGDNCFLGVNSCTAGGLKIGADCVVGAGAVVVENLSEGKIYVGNPAKPLLNKTTRPFILGEETL